MNWAVLIPIIAQHGIPFAFKLWDVIRRNPEPNEEAWKELLAMADKSYDQYIEDAKKRLGV